MKKAEEILLNHFGCATPSQLFTGYGIDLTEQAIIIRAMKAYAEQAIDRCAEVASTKGIDWRIDIMDEVLKVKSELK